MYQAVICTAITLILRGPLQTSSSGKWTRYKQFLSKIALVNVVQNWRTFYLGLYVSLQCTILSLTLFASKYFSDWLVENQKPVLRTVPNNNESIVHLLWPFGRTISHANTRMRIYASVNLWYNMKWCFFVRTDWCNFLLHLRMLWDSRVIGRTTLIPFSIYNKPTIEVVAYCMSCSKSFKHNFRDNSASIDETRTTALEPISQP